MFGNYPDIHTEIIAASVRNPIHITDCALAGAHIATVPYKVLEPVSYTHLGAGGTGSDQHDQGRKRLLIRGKKGTARKKSIRRHLQGAAPLLWKAGERLLVLFCKIVEQCNMFCRF